MKARVSCQRGYERSKIPTTMSACVWWERSTAADGGGRPAMSHEMRRGLRESGLVVRRVNPSSGVWAKAVQLALNWAFQEGWQEVHVLSDSKVVTQTLDYRRLSCLLLMVWQKLLESVAVVLMLSKEREFPM
uniref:Uncharacterized protein n=1 Tax=Cannabis sativa TaxID=3483 RepID=A0A803P2W8_CANSA